MKLTTWERLSLARIIEGGSATSIGQLRRALGILDRLRMTDEEREQIGYTMTGEIQTWADSETEWEIELSPSELVLVREMAQRFSWPVVQGEQVLALAEKLGVT